MSSVLKGNFSTKNSVIAQKKDNSLEERFEREALKHIGGSIAFVSKKKVMWSDEESNGGAPPTNSG